MQRISMAMRRSKGARPGVLLGDAPGGPLPRRPAAPGPQAHSHATQGPSCTLAGPTPAAPGLRRLGARAPYKGVYAPAPGAGEEVVVGWGGCLESAYKTTCCECDLLGDPPTFCHLVVFRGARTVPQLQWQWQVVVGIFKKALVSSAAI